MSLFLKKSTVVFNQDNIKLLRNTDLEIVNVLNDYSSCKQLIFNGLST